MKRLWHQLFLEERPSIGLSFFRIFVALTTGFHVLPSFVHPQDNYYSTAFKIFNTSFFPTSIVELVQKSPDGVVQAFIIMFCVFWFFFLIGLWSQLSCILMTFACYYFYALNSFHIGTLSWDILIVTLFLMCMTPYHGDYFSLDCLLRGKEDAYKRKRPFFLQRLLQMQIAFNYFYTGLYKITAQGNWLAENPIYSLMNYPPEGVVKYFILRDFFMDKPQLCYAAGIAIVITELSMPFLLFNPKTRLSGIYLGFFFHIVLILTLDVPAIFFFLFPPQLLLMIHPDRVIEWIEEKRLFNQSSPKRSKLVYDGHCQFCLESVKRIRTLDMFLSLELVDYQEHEDLSKFHPHLTHKEASSQLHLVEPGGKLYGGFNVFRRICFTLPMLYPLIPILYFPGMKWIGAIVYKFIAKNRYFMHFHPICKTNSCFR